MQRNVKKRELKPGKVKEKVKEKVEKTRKGVKNEDSRIKGDWNEMCAL